MHPGGMGLRRGGAHAVRKHASFGASGSAGCCQLLAGQRTTCPVCALPQALSNSVWALAHTRCKVADLDAAINMPGAVLLFFKGVASCALRLLALLNTPPAPELGEVRTHLASEGLVWLAGWQPWQQGSQLVCARPVRQLHPLCTLSAPRGIDCFSWRDCRSFGWWTPSATSRARSVLLACDGRAPLAELAGCSRRCV